VFQLTILRIRTHPTQVDLKPSYVTRTQVGDCVVADAVTVEPVSTPNFPANRENDREI